MPEALPPSLEPLKAACPQRLDDLPITSSSLAVVTPVPLPAQNGHRPGHYLSRPANPVQLDSLYRAMAENAGFMLFEDLPQFNDNLGDVLGSIHSTYPGRSW